LIERDVTKILPKVRLHWDMTRTVVVNKALKVLIRIMSNGKCDMFGIKILKIKRFKSSSKR